ncbi:MAG: peptidoglycan-binding protein LysM [Burkholderiaceae bacterium]|nr:MAG: peptidoglycan-binding protein LysM [Burkholderiaceae bacterium]TAM04029.1 MAG: peptidoglycan-binding protein LysM [Pusillimonas sp.]
MRAIRHADANTFLYGTGLLVLAVVALMAMCSTAYAARLGHARIASDQGQPLRIAIPVTQLTQQDLPSFSVRAAPAPDWTRAGLVPPVDPATLTFHLVNGPQSTEKILRVSSTQTFSGPVADLLLDVQTATGRQQYQVSVLAPVPLGAAATESSSGSSATGTAPQTTGAASAHRRTIRVRRGNTLFSLARRHAVANVTVYQMMVALQRANPQAFIHGNMNLVKAGSTLGVPGIDELTAVSDREARRIFMRQAQEFEKYRQRLAARKGQALAGPSASKGQVSSAEPAERAVHAAPRPRDEVVLSGGSSSASDAADQREATGKNIAEAKGRVSQLEQNVKNLNRALQSQGSVAKDAAEGVGQAVSDAASSIAAGTTSQEGARGHGGEAAGSGSVSGSTAAAGKGAQSAPGLTGPAAGQAGQSHSSGAAAAASSGAAAVSSGAAATSATSSGATPSSQGGAAAGAPQAQPGTGAAQSRPGASNSESSSVSKKAGHPVSWFQEHVLAVVTVLLALVVLIIAWVLRRANTVRDDDDHGAPITEAMVKEQLDKINLDLHEEPSSDQPSIKS